MSERRWQLTLSQHHDAIDAYLGATARVADDEWYQEPAPGKWSAATLTLHLSDSYEMGCRALAGGASMRLRVPAWKAWFYRTTLLPTLLRRGEFPRVRAPKEIQPDLETARNLTRTAATARLRDRASAAAQAFVAAERDPAAPRLTHAYFGALPPQLALRFLTAHTQHHTKGLVRSLNALTGTP